MSKEILSTNGEKLGEIALNEAVFGVEPNLHVMHLALRRQLNNARQGSASCKTRAEVSGGGKKPWKQKGTGRARAGSLRSPLFAGGGVIFGPKPRSYAFNMPQKARQLALKSALSAKESQLVIVKDFSTIAEPKTKLMVSALKSLNVSAYEAILHYFYLIQFLIALIFVWCYNLLFYDIFLQAFLMLFLHYLLS